MAFVGIVILIAGLLTLFWIAFGAPVPDDPAWDNPPPLQPKPDPFMRYVGRLMTDVEAQQRSNRIKRRKLRALRAEVRRLRNVLHDVYGLDHTSTTTNPNHHTTNE